MFTMNSFGQECPRNWEEIAQYLDAIVDDAGITGDYESITAEERETVNNVWESYWSAYHSGELPQDAPQPITD